MTQIKITIDQLEAYEKACGILEKEGYITQEDYLKLFPDTVQDKLSPIQQLVDAGAIRKNGDVYYMMNIVRH